jgi:hypothetical protein
MRSVPYSKVEQMVASACGWNSELLSTEQAALINTFLNLKRVPFAWDAFAWPEWSPVQKRTFCAPWAAATAYVAGNQVYDYASSTYYVALCASTGQAPENNLAYWAEMGSVYAPADYEASEAYVRGNQVYYPATDSCYQLYAATSTNNLPTDTTKWGLLSPLRRLIEYEQAWEDDALGDVLAVWDSDPELDRATAGQVDFVEAEDGILVMGSDPVVYVEFRRRVPDYSGADYDATDDYAVGSQVFSGGDYYQAIVANGPTVVVAGSSPVSYVGAKAVTQSAYWSKIQFPYTLARYCALGAAADINAKVQGGALTKPMEEEETYTLLVEEFTKRTRVGRRDNSTQLAVR